MSLMKTKVDFIADMQTEIHPCPYNLCILEYIHELYQQAVQNCTQPEQQKLIFQLLKKYGEVFSKSAKVTAHSLDTKRLPM